MFPQQYKSSYPRRYSMEPFATCTYNPWSLTSIHTTTMSALQHQAKITALTAITCVFLFANRLVETPNRKEQPTPDTAAVQLWRRTEINLKMGIRFVAQTDCSYSSLLGRSCQCIQEPGARKSGIHTVCDRNSRLWRRGV